MRPNISMKKFTEQLIQFVKYTTVIKKTSRSLTLLDINITLVCDILFQNTVPVIIDYNFNLDTNFMHDLHHQSSLTGFL